MVELLQLAHLYGVQWVLNECERHLLTSYELTRVDRLLLADRYGLKELGVSLCLRNIRSRFRGQGLCL